MGAFETFNTRMKEAGKPSEEKKTPPAEKTPKKPETSQTPPAEETPDSNQPTS